MHAPVAVMTPFPVLQYGLASMLADTGFTLEEPDDPHSWVAQPGHRALLVAVGKARDVGVLIDLRQAGKNLFVIALLPEVSYAAVRDAVKAGASTVAGWDTSSENLVALLVAGLNSRSIIPTQLLQELTAYIGDGSRDVELDQEQVGWLRALAKGMTVTELAESISYSEREVYRLLRALYDRLGVCNRTEALIWAVRHDIVE
jgi:DNA-binding NarL/FixJ family response regulator